MFSISKSKIFLSATLKHSVTHECVFNILCARFYSQQEKSVNQEHFFGFQEVSANEKREKVQSVFTNVAAKYDLMNDIMSIGIHRIWKDYFIHSFCPIPGTKLLDVAGGTGDISFRFLKASLVNQTETQNAFDRDNFEQSQSHATVLDLNDKMLSICKVRAENHNLSRFVSCVQGNAEVLPFPDNSFDAYTIAFGIRNVVHIVEALQESFRVLKPGGRFMCLEFSKVENPLVNRMCTWYNHEILPVMGEIIVGDWKSYQYLAESIQKFPSQEEFRSMIRRAGFCSVSYENLSNGIVAIHSGFKL